MGGPPFVWLVFLLRNIDSVYSGMIESRRGMVFRKVVEE